MMDFCFIRMEVTTIFVDELAILLFLQNLPPKTNLSSLTHLFQIAHNSLQIVLVWNALHGGDRLAASTLLNTNVHERLTRASLFFQLRKRVCKYGRSY